MPADLQVQLRGDLLAVAQVLSGLVLQVGQGSARRGTPRRQRFLQPHADVRQPAQLVQAAFAVFLRGAGAQTGTAHLRDIGYPSSTTSRSWPVATS